MKRLICALLALIMVLALCGCSKGGDAPSATTLGEADEGSGNQEPETREVTLGELRDGVYYNAYAGFTITLDEENWEPYTAEQLQDISDLTQEALQDSAMGEQLAEYEQITDMMAECYNDLTSLNVLYTRLDMMERAAYALLSEEQQVDSTLDQKELLIQTYADAGIAVESMEKKQVTFLGEEHFAVYTVASIEGTPYYILQLSRYNLGGPYYVTLTLGSFVEDKTAELLDLFAPYSGD